MNQQVMLDLETYGVSNEATILAIGACKFDLYSGKILDEFFCRISLADSIKWKFKHDSQTIHWWLAQDKELRDFILAGTIPVVNALIGFAKFAKNCDVWGNGCNFDNLILRNAYKRVGIKCPMHYRDDRDLRTLVALGTMLGIKPYPQSMDSMGLVEHHPLDDAIYAANIAHYYFKQIMKLRRKRE